MRDKTALLALATAIFVTGCASQPTSHIQPASQAQSTSNAHSRKADDKQARALELQVGQTVAIDLINTLSSVYPPAKTKLVLSHPATDVFGSTLVAGLRGRGYAVVEPDLPTRKTRQSPPRTIGGSSSDEGGVAFDYRVSQVDEVSLYEVVLTVGATRLARAYVLDEKRVLPVGEWTRRE